ncbi:MAG: acetyl-CoA carboxylase biotin carboxyl carrier protein subunit [Rhodospirillaceae bacterium]|nr:acetyl-CoA carboxylase biotin carboxyl carrier protein subunit [Rhodospirillaceae bacterium]
MSKEPKGSATSSAEINSELVRQLANILDETELSEIEYDTGTLRIRVARHVGQTSVALSPPPPPQAAAASPVPSDSNAKAVDASANPGAVKAPMVGVAYLASEPDSPPFIKPGDTVTEGQTLLLIEAMKTFNPVPAPKAGTLAAILVTDGQPVEFDQPLVVIE